MKLLSTIKNKLSALAGLFSRESAPAGIERRQKPEPIEIPPIETKTGISLPRLALAVLTKQVSKKHAFKLASAYYGEDGKRELAGFIAEARKKWLPRPGQVRMATDGTVYEVQRDGSYRKRPDMIPLRPQAAGVR